nr:phospholipase D-like domain-containing protein [Clostridioides sp.]
MNIFMMQPNVYSTDNSQNLINLLEKIWIDKKNKGKGTIYIISGFANYNGGVRFYPYLKDHIEHGGNVVVFLGGSSSQRLSSRQVVEQLIECGADVNVINRKKILHSKCYGIHNTLENRLIVTSGNFTGPGMSQNVESAILLDTETVNKMNFSWEDLANGIKNQGWDVYKVVKDKCDPVWNLLYDEEKRLVKMDESQKSTMILKLVHNDISRIMAEKGTNAYKGSQYFFLSKYCFDFFPALTIKNDRGIKNTYSCIVKLHYIDLNITDNECRVTFESENNVDFRMGTGKLRGTKLAQESDLATITRVDEYEYELRIIKSESDKYLELKKYAVNFVGNRGKQYGFIPNSQFYEIIK